MSQRATDNMSNREKARFAGKNCAWAQSICMQRMHDARKHGGIMEIVQNKVSMSENGIFARDSPQNAPRVEKQHRTEGSTGSKNGSGGRSRRSRRIDEVSGPGGRRKISERRRRRGEDETLKNGTFGVPVTPLGMAQRLRRKGKLLV